MFLKGGKSKERKESQGEGKRLEPASSLKSSEILKVPK